jgi:putative ABC transport system ATP-binding protein
VDPAGTHGAEVRVEHVCKRYGAGVVALDDVSLVVEAGELVLLTGPSGSGKSTLLNIVAGLDEPDSGHVIVDGQPLGEIADRARFLREVVGFVFQRHHLIEALSAEQNVELALIPAGGPRSGRLSRARAALAEVGLEHRLGHRPAELSGGERQRVAIARALVGRPRLLLADEPTGALDSEASARVMDLLATLRRRHGMTVVLVSYDPLAVARADRVVTLRDGRLSPAPQPAAYA